jgi:hypothetical protein
MPAARASAWFRFHAGLEVGSVVDGGSAGEHLIEEVAIVNRTSQHKRFRTFRIESSLDGASLRPIQVFGSVVPNAIAADLLPLPEYAGRATTITDT